jgi:hypothetical protein
MPDIIILYVDFPAYMAGKKSKYYQYIILGMHSRVTGLLLSILRNDLFTLFLKTILANANIML